MCGIIGMVAAPGATLPAEAVIRAMNDAIRHRGPDDEGYFRDQQVVIGMRRLSIIDLAGGHQPVHNEDESLQCVFNGEIYNYRELRVELEKLGHKFYTHSDTEVIVHGYEAWGDGCFARLDGMFGLALWDRRARTLVLARDRYGEKPLFYSQMKDGLVFASELKSLLPLPGFRREVDAEAVRAYVTFGYVPTPGSIFSGVKKLPPGHFLRVSDGKIEVQRYYTLSLGPKYRLSEAEAEEELARLLDEAVKSRLVSDVPFGAFLSGGLDSSVVVALMARHLSQPVRTFSIGFREEKFNELSDARRVADHIHTEHHELVVEPNAVELLQELVWYLDEPFADASAVPTFLVAKLAREHVKMVLTGDGGDEAFAGYDRHVRFLDLERVGALKPVVATAAHLAGRLVPRSGGYRLRRIAERLRQPFPDSYLSGVALTRADVSDELLGDAVRGGGGHYAALSSVSKAAMNLEALDRCIAIDFASYLPDDCLVKIDRMAMANSLEGRAPLLAHKVVDFAVKLPREMRVQGRRGKHLLRRVAARWLPPAVLEKPKKGFGIPLDQWFRGPLKGLAGEVIESRAFRERGLMRQNAARRYLADHLAGQADYGEILWLILSLELWARRFLDRESLTVLKFLLFFQLLYVVNQVHFPLQTHIPGVAVNNLLFLAVLLAMRGKPDPLEIKSSLKKPLLILYGCLAFAWVLSQVLDFGDFVADLTNLKNLISFTLFYFVYLHSKQDEKTTRWMIIWILAIAAIAGVEAIREGFDYGFGKYNPFRRASGPFDVDWHGANVAGVFFGMFMPMFVAIALFLRKSLFWRLAGIGGILLMAGGAIFTYSRQSYFIILLGTALLFLRKSVILAAVVAVTLVSLAGYLPDSVFQRVDETKQTSKRGEESADVSTASRWEIWAGGMGMVADHPIGVGLRRFPKHIGQYCSHKGYDAHNFYVLILAEGGPQGLIAFLYLIWCVFRLARWMRQNAPPDDPEAQALTIGFTVCTVCMCLGGLYGSPLLREGAMMAPYWALAGLLERYIHFKQKVAPVERRVATLVERFPLAAHGQPELP